MKKQKTNFNHTFLLNNKTVNGSFESRAFKNKLRVSLTSNLRAVPGMEDNQAAALVDQFMREDVIVDMHRINVDRQTDNIRIVPVTNSVLNSYGNPHRFINGVSANLRDRRGLNVAKTKDILMLVGVTNYLPPDQHSPHKNHAISAFRHNGILFCFNPWGETYITTNQRSSRVLPDNHIWERLRKQYQCHTAFVYTGHNFQQANSDGACVGFASEFGSHMYNFMLHQRLKASKMVFYPHEQIGYIVYSKEYNAFVTSLFERFKGSFSNARTCNIATFTTNLFSKLKSNSVSTKIPNNARINTDRRSNTDMFDKVVTLLNNEMEFRSAMKSSKWLNINEDERIRSARSTVRRRLREKFPQMKKVHGNTINASIKRYIASGDIQLKNNKNNMNINF